MLRFTHTLVLLACAGAIIAQPHSHDHVRVNAANGHRHYEFIPNKGQFQSNINYSVKLVGGKMFVEDKSLVFHFVDNSAIAAAHHKQKKAGTKIKGHAYRMNWINAQTPSYNESSKTKKYYNFFKGNDRSKWKGAWEEKRSLGSGSKVSEHQSTKLIAARLLSITPLGLPVEPEV